VNTQEAADIDFDAAKIARARNRSLDHLVGASEHLRGEFSRANTLAVFNSYLVLRRAIWVYRYVPWRVTVGVNLLSRVALNWELAMKL